MLSLSSSLVPVLVFSPSLGKLQYNKGRDWWSQARTLQDSLITWKTVLGLWPEFQTKKGNSSCSPIDKMMCEVRMKIIWASKMVEK